MKSYEVNLKIFGQIYGTVEANSEQEAIQEFKKICSAKLDFSQIDGIEPEWDYTGETYVEEFD